MKRKHHYYRCSVLDKNRQPFYERIEQANTQDEAEERYKQYLSGIAILLDGDKISVEIKK